MSDDKKINNPDQQKLNAPEAYEPHDWSRKYGISFDQLKRVIKDAGSIARDVEDFLKKRSKNSRYT